MEGLLALLGLFFIFVLFIVPAVAFSTNSRSHRLEAELKKLRAEVATLRERLEASPVGQSSDESIISVQSFAASGEEAPVASSESELTSAQSFTAGCEEAPAASSESEFTSAQSFTAGCEEAPAASSESELTSSQSFTASGEEAPAQSSELEFTPAQPFERNSEKRQVPSSAIAAVEYDNEGGAKGQGMLSALFDWFMRGNPLAKVGVLLLFFGLAYLMKYSIERDMLPVELRLVGASVIALGLLGLGWYLRQKQTLYALILQGGATGALYITVLGACQLWELLPSGLAFALLLLICIASVVLALLQRSLSLAMLASTGGYLAPVLLSTNSGNYIALFAYYLLLSLGILAITVRRPWRPLLLLGFIFSFSVAALWGMNDYRPQYWPFCQFFLAASLFIFGILGNIFSLRTRIPDEKMVDSVLMLGPPLVGFGMQYVITAHWRFGPAFSALGFGLLYLALAGFAVRRIVGFGKPFIISALGLGACFTTLAIPLALSAKWTAFAWALEGLGILWIGQLQKQRNVSYSGTGLLLLAVGSAAYAAPTLDRLSFCLVFGIISLAWLAAAWLWRHRRVELEVGLLVGGITLWVIALIKGVQSGAVVDVTRILLLLALMTLSTLIWFAMAKRLRWPEVGYGSWLLWPAMLVVLGSQVSTGVSLLNAGWANLAWPLALAAAFFLLRRAQLAPQKNVTQWLLAGVILVWVGVLFALVQPASLTDTARILLLLALMTLSTLIWFAMAKRLRWPEVGYGSWLLWPAMLVVLGSQVSTGMSLLNAGWANLAWPLALAAAFFLLRRAQLQPEGQAKLGLHLSLLWIILLTLGYELLHQLNKLPWWMAEWKMALVVGACVAVILLIVSATRRGYWPFDTMPQAYGVVGMAPLVAFLLLFAITGNTYDGVTPGWTWIPLINPLEIGAGLALCTLMLWGNFARPYLVNAIPELLHRHWKLAGVVLAIWWGNGMVLRILSWYGNIDWLPQALWASRLVQTTMSLLWGLIALVLMVLATRRGKRNDWFVGAAVMGVLIVKLFLIDSARGGGLMRALAFIGVAILVLIIGYFSPVPPRAAGKDSMENKG